MRDEDKTKEMLLIEIEDLRRQVAELIDERAVRFKEDETPMQSESSFPFEAEAFSTMYRNHNAIMYIVDLETFFIVDANNAALKFYGYDIDTIRSLRIPDLNTEKEEEIRAEIKRAVAEGRDYYLYKHRLANNDIRDVEIYAYPITIKGKPYSFSIVHDVTEHRKAEAEREQLIVTLQSAQSEIKSLKGILPICSVCHKIRDDKGYWTQVEEYVCQHSEADFSHSLCPDCVKEYYSDLDDDI